MSFNDRMSITTWPVFAKFATWMVFLKKMASHDSQVIRTIKLGMHNRDEIILLKIRPHFVEVDKK